MWSQTFCPTAYRSWLFFFLDYVYFRLCKVVPRWSPNQCHNSNDFLFISCKRHCSRVYSEMERLPVSVIHWVLAGCSQSKSGWKSAAGHTYPPAPWGALLLLVIKSDKHGVRNSLCHFRYTVSFMRVIHKSFCITSLYFFSFFLLLFCFSKQWFSKLWTIYSRKTDFTDFGEYEESSANFSKSHIN